MTVSGCTSIAADARTFAGTRWQVTAIDGRPTPRAGDYHLEFTMNVLSGRFGCNAFGGPYTVKGAVMIAGQIESTLMACVDPAGRFETEGFAILRQPMRLDWASSTHVTLTNNLGSIALELRR